MLVARLAAGAPLIAYGLLATVFLRPVWASPTASVLGYGPDPPFFIWAFRWLPFALTHGLNPLVTTYIDFPTGVNLMASTSAPLLDLLLWPVTQTAGPLFAYNLAVAAGITLSAWSCFLLCRRLVASRLAAFLAGAVYGFSPFMVGHALAHPHLVFAMFPPLFFLVGYQLVVGQPAHPARWGVLLGLMAAAQFYISEELLAIEVVGGVLAIAAAAALFPSDWRSRLRAASKPLGLGITVCAALTAIPISVQFFGPQHVIGTVNPSGYYVSDLLGFITPDRLQWLSPGAAQRLTDRFTGNLVESTAYLGLPLLVVAGFTTVRFWKRPLVRFAGVLAGMLALLSLGPTLHIGGIITPIPSLVLALTVLLFGRRRFPVAPILLALTGLWGALAIAPVIRDIMPGRLSVLVTLLACVLLAVFVDAANRFRVRHRIASGAVTGALLLGLVPATTPPTAYAIPAFFQHPNAGMVSPGQVVLVAPYAYSWDDLAMVWQSTAGMPFKMPEGTGTVPGPSIDPPPSLLGAEMIAIDQGAVPTIDPVRRAAWREDLRRWQVDQVVVGPMVNEQTMVRFFVELTGQSPVEIDGVYLWPSVGASGAPAG